MRIAGALPLFCVALALALIDAPALAQQPADKTAEADERFRRGVALYGDSDFSAALVEFRRAYELMPAYQVLYNIARSASELRDYAGALRTFQKYLADGGARIAADRRAEVEREIAALKLRVGTVQISTPDAGVEISVDEAPIGKTPLAQPLLVSAGRRKIVASRDGRPPVARFIEVAGGDAVKLTFEAPAAPAPAAPATDALSSAALGATPAPARGAPLLPWIATGALAAGAAVTGVLALGASGDLEDKLGAFPGDSAGIASAQRKTASLALATDILAGAAVIAGGISLYVTIAGDGPRRDAAARSPGPAVRAAIAPSGVRLLGTF